MSLRLRVVLPILATTVLVVPALLPACAGETGDSVIGGLDPATAVVEYRYSDTSVPPEFHRSYTLTVRDGEARVVVDVYGDELHDVTEPVSDTDWRALLDRVERLGAGIGRGDADIGCDGGTGRSLLVTDADHGDDAPALDASVYVCNGGERQAEMLEDVVGPVLERFDMSTLLATG